MIFQQYDDAYRAFSTALQINTDNGGQELIYVLRANSSINNYNRIVERGDAK